MCGSNDEEIDSIAPMIEGWWLITDPLEESQGYYSLEEGKREERKANMEQRFQMEALTPRAGLFSTDESYKATSFVTFTNVFFSSMVHTSQVESPSILAVATAVNPVSDTLSRVEAVHPGGRVPELLFPNS